MCDAAFAIVCDRSGNPLRILGGIRSSQDNLAGAPLDVFVFRNYKRCLQKAHRRLISGASEGFVTNALWLSQLAKTASEFLCHRNWHDAFVQTGATGSQTTLTKALESYNGLPSPQLTASNLRALFPRNRQVDSNFGFNPVLQAGRAHLRARQ